MPDPCLVRQPLFGVSGTLLGYDIRFKEFDVDAPALVQSVLNGTLDVVRGNLPAFVACSRSQLIDGSVDLIDTSSSILVLAPDMAVDDDVRAAVVKWGQRDGMIALSGITVDPCATEALAPYANWIRLDMRGSDPDALEIARARIVAICGDTVPHFAADHVDDEATYELAMDLGAAAFQGLFFSRPEPLPATEFPQSTMSAMRLMGMARDPKVNDRQLEDVISTDPVLMFQLLRLVNSAAVGLRGVSSIGQALRMIGRTTFQRWLAMAVASSRRSETDVDAELVRQAVERGRLMEQLARGEREAGTLFLVGLFSMLDAVFRMPLTEIVERVALSDDATAALIDRTGIYADALSFAESYELGLFEHAADLASDMGVDPEQIAGYYTAAIAWTAEALGAVLDSGAESRGKAAAMRG